MPRTHGARSVELVRHKRAFQRRRILAALNADAGTLSPIALGYLENLARVRVQLLLADREISRHGMYDENGTPAPFAAFYIALLNSERHAIKGLAQHLPAEVDVDAFYRQFQSQ